MADSYKIDSHPISVENYRFICDLAYKEAALVLNEGKEYLVESRLSELSAKHKFASLNAFVDSLRIVTFPNTNLIREIVDALTTNETLFFRDFHPFEALRKEILPELLNKYKDQKIIIWSAASSFGQEAYSIAMLISEAFPSEVGRIQILATDISGNAIRRAKAGVYQQLEVNRGLPAPYLIKYFQQVPNGWLISDRIRKMVDFREMNLCKPWQFMPKCNIILIRNVMIYFDIPQRKFILNSARSALVDGGYLFLGGAETTLMIDDLFTPMLVGKATVYKVLGKG